MNRKDRRRQQKISPGGTRRGGPSPPAAKPASVSELLLRHAGQPDGMPLPPQVGPELLQGGDDAVAAAFAVWRNERELDQRIAEVERALREKPDSVTLHLRLGDLQIQRRHHQAALETYRRCQRLDPSRRELDHLIAALSGEEAPSRASGAYVANLFDGFAERFDETLVHWLEYRGPEVARAAAARVLGERPGKLDVLDLGCGTGLNAPLFRPIAARLDGVDISAGMLHQARKRGLYDALAHADLLTHLAASERRYDLVLATDVLIYFGRLEPVFEAVRRVLRPGGLFIGTVEIDGAAAADWRLARSGRYVHAEGYVRRIAADAGLTLAEAQNASVRHESGQPVPGLCFACLRPAD